MRGGGKTNKIGQTNKVSGQYGSRQRETRRDQEMRGDKTNKVGQAKEDVWIIWKQAERNKKRSGNLKDRRQED